MLMEFHFNGPPPWQTPTMDLLYLVKSWSFGRQTGPQVWSPWVPVKTHTHSQKYRPAYSTTSNWSQPLPTVPNTGMIWLVSSWTNINFKWHYIGSSTLSDKRGNEMRRVQFRRGQWQLQCRGSQLWRHQKPSLSDRRPHREQFAGTIREALQAETGVREWESYVQVVWHVWRASTQCQCLRPLLHGRLL